MVQNLDINELQRQLSEFDGWTCSFGEFTRSHSRLVLYLESKQEETVKVEVHLFFLDFVKGPTQWQDCKLKVVTLQENPGYYKISDERVGFEAIGFDEININGERNCMFHTKR